MKRSALLAFLLFFAWPCFAAQDIAGEYRTAEDPPHQRCIALAADSDKCLLILPDPAGTQRYLTGTWSAAGGTVTIRYLDKTETFVFGRHPLEDYGWDGTAPGLRREKPAPAGSLLGDAVFWRQPLERYAAPGAGASRSAAAGVDPRLCAGTFSNMWITPRFHEIQGEELTISPGEGPRLRAAYRVADFGEPSPPASLDARCDGVIVSFTVPASFERSGRFQGRVTDWGIRGIFTTPDGKRHILSLPRRLSPPFGGS